VVDWGILVIKEKSKWYLKGIEEPELSHLLASDGAIA
jgi:hypothetical protein